MRTTVGLDPDVDARLRALARERGVSLRTVINDALRDGIRPQVELEPYKMPTFAMGLRPDVNWDKALALAAELEDEENIRKLEQGR